MSSQGPYPCKRHGNTYSSSVVGSEEIVGGCYVSKRLTFVAR